METATTSTRFLEIDGMSGDTCVQKVTSALKGVHGVSTQSVKVGSATIGATQAGTNAACAAIDTAGYKAHEGARIAEANGTPRATAMNPSMSKGHGQSCTPAQIPAIDTEFEGNTGGVKGSERPIGTAPAKITANTN